MNKDVQNAPIIIRPATMNDIPLIQNIVNQTWPEAYTSILGEKQVTYMLEIFYNTQSLEKQMKNGHHFLLATNDAQAVGFASFSGVSTDIYKLQKLYVLPTQQKSGAGKALLQAVEKEVKKGAAAKLQLNVNRYNIAKTFYEKNGFAVIEQADIDIGSGYFMNDYIMQKDL